MISRSASNEFAPFPPDWDCKSMDRWLHPVSAKKLGSLKTTDRQTSKIFTSVKNLCPGPDRHASGPLAMSALDVPWTRCWIHPCPEESVMSW